MADAVPSYLGPRWRIFGEESFRASLDERVRRPKSLQKETKRINRVLVSEFKELKKSGTNPENVCLSAFSDGDVKLLAGNVRGSAGLLLSLSCPLFPTLLLGASTLSIHV